VPLFHAAAGSLDEYIADLAASGDGVEMLRLGFDELVKRLLSLVQLLLAECRVALQAGALNERRTLLVENGFFERIGQGRIFFGAS